MESLGIKYNELEQKGIRFIVAPELANTAITDFGLKFGEAKNEGDDTIRASVEPGESGLGD